MIAHYEQERPSGVGHFSLPAWVNFTPPSTLVAGLQQHLPAQVGITGGLAGDGDRFKETLLLWNGQAEPHSILVLGFYGTRLRVGSGSFGGWEAFGPYRQVTRSSGNRLYELDGRSALSLYQAYLGEQAPELPAAGLLFPLSVLTSASEKPVVRTLLAIHEADQSVTFAGDVPEGSYAQVMRTTIPHLVAGAMKRQPRLVPNPWATPPPN